MQTVVIHACSLKSDIQVFAFEVTTIFYPPPRMGPDAQEAFARFNIEWYEGTAYRADFLVLIPKQDGNTDYSLVIDSDDPETAHVGIRAYSGGKPDPNGKVLWARQGIEPRDWFNNGIDPLAAASQVIREASGECIQNARSLKVKGDLQEFGIITRTGRIFTVTVNISAAIPVGHFFEGDDLTKTQLRGFRIFGQNQVVLE